MRIGVDVDGVLADQTTAYLPLMKQNYKQIRNVEKKDINKWYYFTEVHGISVEEVLRIMEMSWQTFWNVPLEEPEIPQCIKTLRDLGHKIIVISHRTRSSYPYVCKWLDWWNIHYDQVTFMTNGGSKFEESIDCLIDDSPSAFKDALKHQDKILYLRRQPWNRSLGSEVWTENIISVDTFIDACKMIARV